MKNNDSLINQFEESNPKDFFEKIIQTETEIASQITLVTEEANKNIEDARKNLPILRKSIIDDTRVLREKRINQGVKGFKEEGARKILDAKKQGDVMIEEGKEFISQAVSEIFHFLISGKSES